MSGVRFPCRGGLSGGACMNRGFHHFAVWSDRVSMVESGSRVQTGRFYCCLVVFQAPNHLHKPYITISNSSRPPNHAARSAIGIKRGCWVSIREESETRGATLDSRTIGFHRNGSWVDFVWTVDLVVSTVPIHEYRLSSSTFNGPNGDVIFSWKARWSGPSSRVG